MLDNIKFRLYCQCGLTSTYYEGEEVPSPVVCQCCGDTLTKLSWILMHYKLDTLTEEQAKDLCVEMWNEMAEHNYTSKYRSKLIQRYSPDCECFACEYYDPRGIGTCTRCAFQKYAYAVNRTSVGCTCKGSPFHTWYNCSQYDRDSAIAIADLFID